MANPSTFASCPACGAHLTVQPTTASADAEAGDVPSPRAACRRGRKFGLKTILLICLLAAGAVTFGADWFLRAKSAGEYQVEDPRVADMKLHPPVNIPHGLEPEMQGMMARHGEQVGNQANWLSRKLKVGTLAAAITLPENRDGHEVRLADFRGRKPVVLMFGSFSCDVFCDQVDQLERLYRNYKDRAEFLFIHVSDAYHNVPALQHALEGLRPATKNRAERTRRAVNYLGLTFPSLIDTADGASEIAYDAWPKRLVIIDTKGQIAFDAGRGLPDGWDLKEVEAWLREHTS
jgi:peroxiredoxin